MHNDDSLVCSAHICKHPAMYGNAIFLYTGQGYSCVQDFISTLLTQLYQFQFDLNLLFASQTWVHPSTIPLTLLRVARGAGANPS